MWTAEKNNRKTERKGVFLLLAILVQTGHPLLTLTALTDIYTFVIMTALSTAQRAGEISKGGRGDKVTHRRN